MASYYSVVRFVPSALAEEFVNIGVLVIGDGHVRGKFLEDWGRVERFAQGRDVRHARDFQEWVLGSMVPEGLSDRRMKAISEEDVHRISKEWIGSIQVTPPRASILSPEVLLEDIAPTFLGDTDAVELAEEAEVVTRFVHHKRKVVRATVNTLKEAIGRRGKHGLMVKTQYPISANVRTRVFDIVIGNGVPKHAVQCFNFYVADPRKILEQVDATAFAVEDVRRKSPLGVSVIASAPTDDTAMLQAKNTFSAVGVPVVLADDIAGWSESLVGELVAPNGKLLPPHD
jgi:hypothetical protein